MNKLSILIATTAVSIGIGTAGYLILGESHNTDDTPITVERNTTGNIINNTKTQVNDLNLLPQRTYRPVVSMDSPIANNPVQISLSSALGREGIHDFLQKNPALLARISRMKWYQDFLVGGFLTPYDIETFIQYTQEIEFFLQTNPRLGKILQESPEWPSYLSGDMFPTNVTDIINAIQYIDDFQQKNPEVYALLQENPFFNYNADGTPASFMNRKFLIESILWNANFLQENPEIMPILALYGYSPNDVYTKAPYSIDTSDEYGEHNFVSNMNAVAALSHPENFPPEVWSTFMVSEIGQRYMQGGINPVQALRYLSELMNN